MGGGRGVSARPACAGWRAAAWAIAVLLLAGFAGCVPEVKDVAKELPSADEKFSLSVPADYYVSSSLGLDTNLGTSAQPFKTITHALTVALGGQIVQVLPGTYDGANGEVFPPILPAGVILRGDAATRGSTTVISGSGASPTSGQQVVLDPGAGATIDGFSLVNSTTYVLYLSAPNVIVQNNTIQVASEGVWLYNGVGGHTIRGNTFTPVTPGLGGAVVVVAPAPTTWSKLENNSIAGFLMGVEMDVAGIDLGGGPAGSIGGNTLSCNTRVDVWVNTGVANVYVANNAWDHGTPSVETVETSTGVDVYDGTSGAATYSYGASTVASAPCIGNLFVNSATGNDANSGATSGAPFKTITHALSLAVSGVTVQVAPGTYDAANGEVFPLAVPAGVNLLGDPATQGSSTVIASGGVNTINNPGTGSTIDGFTLQASLVPGINLISPTVTVQNDTFQVSDTFAVVLYGGAGTGGHTIRGNAFTAPTPGSYGLTQSAPPPPTYSKVENNTFGGFTIGIEMDSDGLDLGGGPAGSVGGNKLSCSSRVDVWVNTGLANVYLANNAWDHTPPTLETSETFTGVDTYDRSNGAATFIYGTPTVVASPCGGGSFFVNSALGNDGNAGTPGAPFKTITHALTVAVSGDTVQVVPGTYDVANGEVFPLALPDGVRLLGDPATKGSTTFINGAGLVPATVWTSVIDAGIGSFIGGFTLTPTSGSMGLALKSPHVTIQNNSIVSDNIGVYVLSGFNSGGHTIQGNVFTTPTPGVGNGFVLVSFSGAYSRVENNSIIGFSIGVEFDVTGADMGGGPTGSVGGNSFSCSTRTDLYLSAGLGNVYVANNAWDHNPPTIEFPETGTGVDIVDYSAGVNVIIYGTPSVVASPCP